MFTLVMNVLEGLHDVSRQDKTSHTTKSHTKSHNIVQCFAVQLPPMSYSKISSVLDIKIERNESDRQASVFNGPCWFSFRISRASKTRVKYEMKTNKGLWLHKRVHNSSNVLYLYHDFSIFIQISKRNCYFFTLFTSFMTIFHGDPSSCHSVVIALLLFTM